MLNNRNQVNIAKAQVGFMNFIVIGTFEAWAKLLPQCQKNVDQVKENKKTWETLTDSYEKMMKEGYNMKKLLDECEEQFEVSK